MKKILSVIAISIVLLMVSNSFTTISSSMAGTEIAVIINNGNPISTLSAGEAKLYFLRKIKSIKSCNKINAH
ncbi:MAG: hypothetical protein AABZ32_01070, partial [Bacteroidota bacterium]